MAIEWSEGIPGGALGYCDGKLEYVVSPEVTDGRGQYGVIRSDSPMCLAKISTWVEALAFAERDFAERLAAQHDWTTAERCDGQLCYYHGCQRLPGCTDGRAAAPTSDGR